MTWFTAEGPATSYANRRGLARFPPQTRGPGTGQGAAFFAKRRAGYPAGGELAEGLRKQPKGSGRWIIRWLFMSGQFSASVGSCGFLFVALILTMIGPELARP